MNKVQNLIKMFSDKNDKIIVTEDFEKDVYETNGYAGLLPIPMNLWDKEVDNCFLGDHVLYICIK